MNKKIYSIGILIIFCLFLASAASFTPPTTASYSNYQTYYGSEASVYWPILSDTSTCQARQDILLQVAPGGCTPMVVRSDLLAEQNVPVFCQVMAVNINPLVDIKEIKSIRFTGNYPEEVAGTGFHPARAALRTNDILLGSPVTNNIGYVVVILKKNEIESSLPDSVTVNLSAQINYESGNAFGIGTSEFLLEKMSDADWTTNRFSQTFLRGQYSLRLEDADANNALISLYYGDRKISSTKLAKGETSSDIYLPGMYCQAAVGLQFVGSELSQNKAKLEISDSSGLDSIEVSQGSRFLNDKCIVESLSVNQDGLTGSITIRCSTTTLSGSRFTLSLGNLSSSNIPAELKIFNDSAGNFVAPNLISNNYIFNFGGTGVRGEYQLGIEEDSQLFKSDVGGPVIESEYYASLNPADKAFIDSVEKGFLAYKALIASGSSIGISTEKSYDNNGPIDTSFSEAISALVNVSEDYPQERFNSAAKGERYGETALIQAIELAKTYGKQQTEATLLNRFISLYPDSTSAPGYKIRLDNIGKLDYSKATYGVDIDNSFRNIRLVGLSQPTDKPTAYFRIGSSSESLALGSKKVLQLTRDSNGNSIEGYMTLRYLDSNRVILDTNCQDAKTLTSAGVELRLDNSERISATICGQVVKLDRVETKEFAKVRVLPKYRGTEGLTNLSVSIGIEKRAIKLSPEQTKDKISALNDTIKKWEGISENLGNVVTGLKGACFATAGILTFKNFLSGLSGEAIARQKVMKNGWDKWCKDHVSQYNSLDDCFRQNADKIDSDVSVTAAQIRNVNDAVKTAESGCPQTGSGGFLGDKSVNADCAKKALIDKIKLAYPAEANNYVSEGMSYMEIRDAYLNLQLREKLSSEGGTAVTEGLKSAETRVKDLAAEAKIIAAAKDITDNGLAPPVDIGAEGTRDISAQIVPASSIEQGKINLGEDTHSATIRVPTKPGFSAGNYVLGLTSGGSGGVYLIDKVFYRNPTDGSYKEIKDNEKAEFRKTYQLGNVRAIDSTSYNNQIKNPEVKYYETEPYKGMPAIVPFDVNKGWYAATKQTLPIFGGIGAFDASGRVASFWVCNVGKDGTIDFEQSGYGDDTCEQINLQTGQTYGSFPGLSPVESKNLIASAKSALEDASRQYSSGVSVVSILGKQIKVGKPAVSTPETSCADFMSPKECQLLFNVCDPVICPPSRCNLGGKYPVQDVVQTGVIGSTFLCLPNVKEGIFIPVCLTGIKAGIDSYVSVIKSYRDCLQENLNTGKLVGVCDQIYSVYLCEFFWRQIAPVANVILPKLVELAYGQGTRGGGEYMTVMSAWTNMQNSIDYFKSTYAVNSLKAFQARSVEEAGGEFCKGFVSLKSPKSVETLLEPDSPPQFYASFSSTTFTTATVPATSQYKVFYHIFAGNDAGVYYTVYLKNAPESSYYYTQPTVQVASGFVARGEYKSETKDFTAPQGYKELCVRINDKEECGFKQVTTDFAIDYLTDKYAQNELTRKDITSEQECISGSPTVSPALLTGNLQAGVEESAIPSVYNRGIVRICATDNPGKTTDPTRFVESGYCGDPRVKCWLDKTSVNNAITDSNLGVKNETLQTLEQTMYENLVKSGEFDTPADTSTKISGLKDKAKSLDTLSGPELITLANSVISDAKAILARAFLNNQKADLLLVIGLAKKSVALDYLKVKLGGSTEVVTNTNADGANIPEETKTPATASVCGNEIIEDDETCDYAANPQFKTGKSKCSDFVEGYAGDGVPVCNPDCSVDLSECEITNIFSIQLGKSDNTDYTNVNRIYDSLGKYTQIFVKDSIIHPDSFGTYPIGTISGQDILTLDKDKYNQFGLDLNYFNLLNGAKIQGTKIYPKGISPNI